MNKSLIVSFLFVPPVSYSFWLIKSASLQQPLRRPRWTKCFSSPESQSAEWAMETANQGSACSTTIATLESRKRTESKTQKDKPTHFRLPAYRWPCVSYTVPLRHAPCSSEVSETARPMIQIPVTKLFISACYFLRKCLANVHVTCNYVVLHLYCLVCTST